MDRAVDLTDGGATLVLEGLDAPVYLQDDETGYRKAQRLLNQADSGLLTLSPSDREQLNTFIRKYQTSRLRL